MRWEKTGFPKNPFLSFGRFLVEKLQLDHPGKRNRELCREVIALSLENPESVKEYYAKKLADAMQILVLLCIFCLIFVFTSGRDSQSIETNLIDRPGYGMGDREEELTVQIEGETEQEVLSVTIREQAFSEQQAEQFLKNGKKFLEQEIKGENDSLDEVRTELYFPTELEEQKVQVSWLTFPYGVIGEDGSIIGEPEEEGSIVEIQALLSCQGKELLYETAACVYPPILNEKEKLWKKVRENLQEAEESSLQQAQVPLPEKVDGKTITWTRTSQDLLPLFLFLLVVLPICAYVQKDQKIHERAKQRKLQMEVDYPELMWKMTMLLGAGLTIRGAFMRIAAEYQKREQKKIRYVYEEMIYTCHEMKSGIPESRAYENFGRRCELPRYIKLGSILSQNLKKGSKGLAALLEKEAETSMEERKNLAKKLGEQAGTRLIFPMILMFGVVLIVLMVPAFLSF